MAQWKVVMVASLLASAPVFCDETSETEVRADVATSQSGAPAPFAIAKAVYEDIVPRKPASENPEAVRPLNP